MIELLRNDAQLLAIADAIAATQARHTQGGDEADRQQLDERSKPRLSESR